MNKIVVPTDFSPNANKALEYAPRFYQGLACEIYLLYCYVPSAIDVYETTFVDTPQQDLKKDLLENFVKSWKHKNKVLAENINLHSVLRVGFPAPEIVQFCREINATAIVMGTTGEGGFVKKMIGSVSTQVLDSCDSPLILIPPGYEWQKIESILIAVSDSENSASTLYGIKLARSFRADVHILHVEPETGKPLEIDAPLYKYDYDRIRFVQLEDDDVSDTIEDYAEEEAMNLIVMTTRHRSFIEKLFHKSVTKEVSLESTIPVMVLKESKPS